MAGAFVGFQPQRYPESPRLFNEGLDLKSDEASCCDFKYVPRICSIGFSGWGYCRFRRVWGLGLRIPLRNPLTPFCRGANKVRQGYYRVSSFGFAGEGSGSRDN